MVNHTHSTDAQILIVEDELILAEDVRGNLIGLGYSVPYIAVSGEDAVRKTGEIQPDLVLMDIKLHGEIDGIEAAEQIQARFNIPVIYITALSDGATLQRVKASEPFGYIVKPVETRELHIAVEMALYRHRLETKLRESEWKSRAILDHTYEFIGLMTPDGVLIETNRAALDFYGLAESDVIGKLFWETPWWAHSAELREKLRDATKRASAGESVRFEAYHPAPDGQTHYVDFSIKPAMNDAGEVIFLISEGSNVTDHKQVERALRESEERYRTIFETAGVSIWEEDFSAVKAACDELRAQGVTDICRYLHEHPEFVHRVAQMIKIVDVNEMTVKMFGASSKADLLGSLDRIFVPETLDIFREEILAIAEGRTYFEGETVNHTLDGRRLNVLLTMRIPAEAEKLDRVLLSFMDITERKQAEDLIRAQRDLALQLGAAVGLDSTLRLCVEAAIHNTGMDAGGVYLINQASGDLDMVFSTGLSPDFVAVASHFDVDTPNTSLVMAGQPIYVNYRELNVPMDDVKRREGLRAVAILPIQHEGRVIACLNIASRSLDEVPTAARDTLEMIAAQIGSFVARALAQEALSESEKRFRNLFDNAAFGIVICRLIRDEAGKGIDFEHLQVNAATQRHTGFQPQQIVGSRAAEMTSVEEFARPIQVCDQVVATGKPDGYEQYFAIYDRTLDVGAFHIAGDLFALTFVDITERKRIEKQLRQHERLAAVGQLAAGIAHDFRNLLTTIILYTNMALRKPNISPDLANNLGTIIGESKKAADLVQQILDFSSRAMIQVCPLDLESFIGEVTDILRRMIPENIHLSLQTVSEPRAALYIVEADPTRIQQVLMNLATNARDAMPEGGELCFELSRIQLESDDELPVVGMPLPSSPLAGGVEGGQWVCLAVSDTGTGMTEKVRAHVFEPFFTTKEVGKGTGLGLAQVYGIVRQHEGYITVETEVGQGTTFRIYLPSAEVDAKIVAEQVPTTPRGRGETILLVEDNEKLRKAGQDILESLGYRVLVATNGLEALKVYRVQDGMDLIVTDIVMPGMGGKELVQELMWTDANLKAIGVTGYAVEDVTTELRDVGFLDVIHKPFDMDTLARVVRRALDVD